jgi:hypothetical protein
MKAPSSYNTHYNGCWALLELNQTPKSGQHQQDPWRVVTETEKFSGTPTRKENFEKPDTTVGEYKVFPKVKGRQEEKSKRIPFIFNNESTGSCKCLRLDLYMSHVLL